MLILAACGNRPQTGGGAQATAQTAPAATTLTVKGQIVLPDSADATGVTVYASGVNVMAITGESGQYALTGFPVGELDIHARKEGYEPVKIATIDVKATAQPEIIVFAPVTLSRIGTARASATPATHGTTAFGSLRGVILDADGAAPPKPSEVRIRLESPDPSEHPYRSFPSDNGEYIFRNLPPDNYIMTVSAPGFREREMKVRILPGPEATMKNVRLEADGSGTRRIRGFVKLAGENGEVDKNFANVIVEVQGRPDLMTAPSAQGSFTIGRLAPGRYLVNATAAGYVTGAPVLVDLTELPEIEIQLTLDREQIVEQGAQLSGLIVKNDENNPDMSGIQVALMGTQFTLLTNDLGEYAFRNVPPGTYTLIAQAEGYESGKEGPFSLAAGDDLKLEPLLLEPKRNWPEVIEVKPSDGARDVIVRGEVPITVRFNKKMKPETLRKAITVNPKVAFRVFAGKDRPDTDFDLVKVVLLGAGAEPRAKLKTSYTVSISTEATDYEGLRLQKAWSTKFETAAPSVIGTIPADEGVMVVGGQSHIVVSFNDEIDLSTFDGRSFSIRPKLDEEPLVNAETDMETGWTNIHISGPFKPDTDYRVEIGRRVRTTGKHAIENTPYRFKFTTPEEKIFDDRLFDNVK